MAEENSLLKIQKEFETITSMGYREIASSLPKDPAPIGFFCPYVPEELLHAAGAHPFRLMGTPIHITHAKTHLPPYCCHLVKSSLESLLQGELAFLKGVIFSHTCDVMQGLSDIWALQKRLPIHFNLMIPSNLDSKQARPYFKEELERLKDFLESHMGKISPQNLKASIELFNRIRERMKEIYARRRNIPTFLPGDYFAWIIRAGYLMDRVRYLDLLEELLHALPEAEEGGKELIPVYVAGNMTHIGSYFSLIEDAGALVAQDDLCSGARFLRLIIPEDADPIEALTLRYFESFLCPTKHRGVQSHLENLLKEVEDSKAKGIIFLLYKYCEPHFFDYPDLKSALESKGFPTLLLEVEDPDQSREQMKVRIQAFVEMLSPL